MITSDPFNRLFEGLSYCNSAERFEELARETSAKKPELSDLEFVALVAVGKHLAPKFRAPEKKFNAREAVANAPRIRVGLQQPASIPSAAPSVPLAKSDDFCTDPTPVVGPSPREFELIERLKVFDVVALKKDREAGGEAWREGFLALEKMEKEYEMLHLTEEGKRLFQGVMTEKMIDLNGPDERTPE
jgi:hypothetical protein